MADEIGDGVYLATVNAFRSIREIDSLKFEVYATTGSVSELLESTPLNVVVPKVDDPFIFMRDLYSVTGLEAKTTIYDESRGAALYVSEVIDNDTIMVGTEKYVRVIPSIQTTQYTFAITPTPSDAVVKINDIVQSSTTVDENTTITYEISKAGYTTQTGTYTVTESKTLEITLVEKTISDKIIDLYTQAQLIKQALINKGQTVGNDISTYADIIRNISTASNIDVTIALGTFSSAYITQLTIGDTVIGSDSSSSNINSTISGQTYTCPANTEIKFLVHADIRDYTNTKGVLDVTINGNTTNFASPSSWTSGQNFEVTYTVSDTSTVTISATGHEGCVLYNTPILYADGTTKAIEEVKVGDKLIGYDTKTDTYPEVSVLSVFNTTDTSIIKLTLEDDSILELTEDHIIYTDKGWGSYSGKMEEKYIEKDVTSVCELAVGDKVLCAEGAWKELVSIERSEGEYRVYNLDVSDNYNTYIANGVVTHNAPSAV